MLTTAIIAFGTRIASTDGYEHYRVLKYVTVIAVIREGRQSAAASNGIIHIFMRLYSRIKHVRWFFRLGGSASNNR